jgi:hypothetical protein
LEGASLREIDGGNSKRDLRRAFALIENSGTVHFLIAGSESEFGVWVESIERAIQLCSFDCTTAGNATNTPSDYLPSSLEVSGKSSCDDSTKLDRPLGRSLAKVVNAAKVKGHAAVTRGIRNSVQKTDIQPGECESDSGGAEGSANPSVQQMRNRFAGVGQATKNRLGSAIAAVKQKGKEVVQVRRQGATGSNWACSLCTFVNSGKVWECQMCSSTKPSGDQVGLTAASIQFQASSVTEQHDADVTESLDLEEDAVRPRSQIGIKNRFESVVRRAQTATFEGSRLGKFNPRPNDQPQGFGVSKAQKLNNITLGEPILSPTLQEVPLKHLGGTWIVQVELQPQFTLEGKNPIDFVSEEPPNNSDNVSHQGEYFEVKENFENVEAANPFSVSFAPGSDSIQSNSDNVNQFVDLTFKIQAFKYDGGVKSSECVDLIRTLSEIAALYTSLSELMARAPTICFNQGLPKKPQASLNLSTIDGMIATGKLLGGLLELPYRAESIGEPLRSFYGKIR